MVKLNRIYTRTGDAGTSGLVDGSRISKSAPLMAAIGDVDEANSVLGVVVVQMVAGAQRERLLRIQNEMFDLGADLATPWGGEPGAHDLRVTEGQVERLEAAIDRATDDLDPLTSFVLPGGDPVAAALHVARAVVRRAERSMVAANEAAPLNPAALMYINRLSDLLFVLSRHVNKMATGDVLWVPGASR
ncbi:cob(I)yrinic acid a,c-diamide adenosyltransferase [Sphingomonas qomolangmaensis]|uniref:Corrinoid adenosyltransferase n=1 Tax=Sphingomonas qomolangmaensis TaxID=2918765 RepID=A0ABY5LCW7_9SPHN|nr:cob(I)yrinic acid a,c-diamide adenosyltransferase [Sphingomonas qomolangmaensis]UUL84262.1 cob(I)yrinic acid a,c-diamide adenosyltransferase [Sphingomonas qomolangmaensis]